MTKTTYKLAAILAGIAIVAAIMFIAPIVKGAQGYALSHGPHGTTQPFTFFSATTTSATSTNGYVADQQMKIAGAEKVALFFSRSGPGGNQGSSRFEVEVSNDGIVWYDFPKLVGDDASQTATSSVTISAATSTTVVFMNLDRQPWTYVRCLVKEVTDGTHTCMAYAEFNF